MFGTRGEGRQGGLVAIVILVIALIVVLFLWMRDRDSQDAEIHMDIGALPTWVAPVGEGVARSA